MSIKTKRIMCMILILAMTLGLCACGQGSGGKGSGRLDLDYEGENNAQDQQEQQSGFQSWINEAFSFGKKDSTSDGRQGSSEGQSSQGSDPVQSTPNSSGTQPQQGTQTSQQGGQSQPQGQTGTPGGSSSQGTPNGPSGNSSQGASSGPSGQQGSSQSSSGTQTPQGTQTSQQSGQTGNQSNSNSSQGAASKKTVTITIRCDTAVNNGMHMESKWAGIVPASGVILPVTTVEIEDGQTVFDVLAYVCSKYKIHISYRGGTSMGCYVDGINNLFEFDGGRWSGWMYCVNKWYPNYGCGIYYVKPGDVIEWNYTCDLGLDLEGGDIFGAQEWKDTHD